MKWSEIKDRLACKKHIKEIKNFIECPMQYCTLCRKYHDKAWKEKNRKKVNAKSLAYYHKNKNEIYAKRKEKLREYYRKKRNKIII